MTLFMSFKYMFLGVTSNTSFLLTHINYIVIFLPWRNSPSWPRPPHCRGFIITLRHTTLGRTPLDKRSAPRTGLYLTTHNTHKRQTSTLLAGFEPTIPASEQPQTHDLDRAATGIGILLITIAKRLIIL